AARLDDVRALTRRLRSHCPVEALTGRTRHRQVEGRIAVAAYDYAGLGRAELAKRGIFIALDAAEAVRTMGRRFLGDAPSLRVYGLLRSDATLSPHQRDQLHEVFGFNEVTIPRHGRRQRQVDVVIERFRGGPAVGAGLDLLTMKQKGLWRHE